jgi:uncharacterized protein with beta-barrel porin domain
MDTARFTAGTSPASATVSVTASTGTLVMSGPASGNYDFSLTINSGITFNAGGTGGSGILLNTSGTGTLNGNIDQSASNSVFNLLSGSMGNGAGIAGGTGTITYSIQGAGASLNLSSGVTGASSGSIVDITFGSVNSTVTTGGALTITTLSGNGATNLMNLGGVLTVSGAGSSDSAFSGTISGASGGIAVNGRTLTLSGASNSYGGGTFVNSTGTLSIASAANIGGGAAGFTLNGGTLQATGAVSTSGAVQVTDNSTLLLAGGSLNLSGTLTGSGTKTLTVSGGTDVSISTVSVSGGTFTISGNLNTAQTLTQTGGGNLLLPGIVGPVVVSSGAVTVSGTSTGNSSVNFSGTLVLNGTNTGNINVNAGGLLAGGAGTVGGSLILNGGIVLLEASTDVLTVNGNLEVDTTSSIVGLNIDPSGSASLINIGGDANLNQNGRLQIIANDGSYSPQTFTLLSTGGQINGEFGSTNLADISTQLPNLMASLVYNNEALQLILSAPIPGVTSLQLNGLSGNAAALAKYLNSLSPSTLGASFVSLAELEGSALNSALATLSPARNTIVSYMSQMNLFSCSQILSFRTSRQRLFSQRSDKELEQKEWKPEELSASLNRFQKNKESEKSACCYLPYDIWIAGFGNLGTQAEQNQNPRFDFATGGVMLGFCYTAFDVFSSWIDSAIVGASLAYTHTSIDQEHNFGNNTSQAGYLSLSGAVNISSYYIDLAWWNGLQDAENERHQFFSGYSSRAKSSFNSYIGDLHAAVGYDYRFVLKNANGILEPFVGFDWAYVQDPSYNETGGGPYNMKLDSKFSSTLQTEIGVNTYFQWKREFGFFVVQNKFSYILRTPFGVGNRSVNIVGSPGSFNVVAFTQNQSLFSPSLELTWCKNNGLYGAVVYEGEFGSGWTSNEIVGRIGKVF